MKRFLDRIDAGQQLAARLKRYAGRDDVTVLALPRGGVPVAAEVARALHAPLDVFLVRKLGVPGHEELAMGAIATGGVQVLNAEVIEQLGISDQAVERVARAEEAELRRRERAYRGHAAAPDVRGRTVIVVDDGIATGSTMRAAVEALRRSAPARIVVATPTAAADTVARLQEVADEVVAVIAPEDFSAVGQWYRNFGQTTDEEVMACLREAGEARG
jgi:predicted phosphoribosyltransferase